MCKGFDSFEIGAHLGAWVGLGGGAMGGTVLTPKPGSICEVVLGVLRIVFKVCEVTTAASEFHDGLLDGTHSIISYYQMCHHLSYQ